MPTNILRLATSIALTVMALVMMTAGALMVSYQWHEAQAREVVRDAPPGYWRIGQEGFAARVVPARTALAAYTDYPLVGVSARRHFVRLVDQLGEPELYKRAVESVLSVQPGSGEMWLALAFSRLRAGETPDRALAAIEMSRLTAPREGDTMVPRAALVVRLWEVAPAGLRDMALEDITAFGQSVHTPLYQPFKDAMLSKSATVRKEIGARLQARLPPDERFWGFVFGFDWQ